LPKAFFAFIFKVRSPSKVTSFAVLDSVLSTQERAEQQQFTGADLRTRRWSRRNWGCSKSAASLHREKALEGLGSLVATG
jgi:hypothetical protein